MKTNLKMTIVFLLVLIFCFSLIACTKDDATSEKTEAPSVTETSKSTEATEEPIEEEEKWSGTISVAPYMLGPIEEDVITPLVEEMLLEDYGYDVKFENVYLETKQYRELLNLKITSGDAPDIFYPGDVATLYAYQEQDAIAGWDKEFFVENAPLISAYFDAGGPEGTLKDRVDMIWGMPTIDGKMYAVPSVGRNAGPNINAIYNKQWLGNLGVTDLPLTIEEWYDLMVRFTNEDPDQNGKNDTYGFSTTALNAVFGAYGAFPGFLSFDTDIHWYERDGKLIFSSLWDGNKQALALLNKAYTEGILHPEFITGENTGGYWAVSHHFVNGQIGYTNSCVYYHYNTEEATGADGAVRLEFEAVQGEDADIEFAPWPSGPEGYWGNFTRSTINVGSSIVYNSDLMKETEKLGAIFNILDIFSTDLELQTLATWGIEGVHHERIPVEGYGEGRFTPKNLLPDGTAETMYGIRALRNVYGPAWHFNTRDEERIITDQEKFRIDNTTGEQLGGGYVTDLYVALPSESLYMSELLLYRDETWTKMITGELPIEYWDTFVEEFNTMGGEILTKEANDWLNSK